MGVEPAAKRDRRPRGRTTCRRGGGKWPTSADRCVHAAWPQAASCGPAPRDSHAEDPRPWHTLPELQIALRDAGTGTRQHGLPRRRPPSTEAQGKRSRLGFAASTIDWHAIGQKAKLRGLPPLPRAHLSPALLPQVVPRLGSASGMDSSFSFCERLKLF